MKFRYKPVRYNYSSRKGNKIRFLVIHDTGNPSTGANAYMHYRYFNGGNRNASAHYFVDDKGIVQIIGDSYSAWHCGDKWNRKYATRSDVTNSNSIGIEICVNRDGDYAKTYKNTVELVKNLMVKFNIPLSNVVRHFDASGKSCPNHMRPNNWANWWQFKEDIKKPIEWKIDLSKDSNFGGKQMTKDYEGHWAEKAIKSVIEKGIMVGDGQGNFRPDDKITRAEIAVIVDKLVDPKK